MRRQQLKESIGKSEFDLFKTMKELKNILEISEKEREKMKIDLEKRSLGKRSHEPTKELLYSKLSYAQTEIQTASKRVVLEKFGPGPYRVEIELDFPPNEPASDVDTKNATKFVIEMASLELMPHSVHLFLEMVSLKLWNGCSFMRNAGHVIQASHRPYFKTQGQDLRQPFIESGYHNVAFQEYTDKYPHELHTVGFAGRPGGPDWYVSIINNTRNHGPSKKTGLADPCFGKVVDGFDTISRMHKMPVKPGSYRAMEENVGIANARIL